MSDPKVLVATRFFENSSQTDLATFMSFMDPAAVIDFSELERPYAGIYRGREQIERLWHEMLDGWLDLQFQTSNPQAEGDHVVIDVQRTGRIAPARIGVTSELTAGLTIRGGAIVAFRLFQDRADALGAAGMA